MRVVRRIFREVAEGATFRAIGRALEREGVPTPRGARFWDRGSSGRSSWMTSTGRTPTQRSRP